MALARKPYVILDAEILSSSVWSAAIHVRMVWITMLILCDTEGYVGAALPGIAHAAGVTNEQAADAIQHLMKPDPYSRTKQHDGRRVEEVERGYRILNFIEHLDRLSSERAKARDRVRRHRERKMKRDNVDGNVTVPLGNREEGVGSREKGVEKNEQRITDSAPTVAAPAKVSPDVLAVYGHWLERAHTEQRSGRVKTDTLKRIASRLKDGFSVDDLKRAVDVACWDEFYVKQGYYRQPAVIWRNAERVQSLLSKAQHEAARPVPL